MEPNIPNPKRIKAIGILEIVNGIGGIIVVVWMLYRGANNFVWLIFMSTFSVLYVYAGRQIFKHFSIGLNLSLILQILAIPRLQIVPPGITTFNNTVKITIVFGQPGFVWGIDLLAVAIVGLLLLTKEKYREHSYVENKVAG